MTPLTFSTSIAANSIAIWHALWSDKGYRAWAGVFFEGSYLVASSLNVGETVMFLGADTSGIYSRIKSHIPNELIEFQHVASVVEGKPQPLDELSQKWTGATEVYRLLTQNDGFKLEVNLDVMDEHVNFMTEYFPKALNVIKMQSESIQP